MKAKIKCFQQDEFKNKLKLLEVTVMDVQVKGRVVVSSDYADVIRGIIREAEGRSYARLLTYDQLQDAVDRLDARLEGVPKKYKEGIVAYIDVNYMHHYSKTYLGSYCSGIRDTVGTKAKVMYRRGEWRLVEVYRGTCAHDMYEVQLTPDAKRILCNNYIDSMSHWS